MPELCRLNHHNIIMTFNRLNLNERKRFNNVVFGLSVGTWRIMNSSNQVYSKRFFHPIPEPGFEYIPQLHITMIYASYNMDRRRPPIIIIIIYYHAPMRSLRQPPVSRIPENPMHNKCPIRWI